MNTAHVGSTLTPCPSWRETRKAGREWRGIDKTNTKVTTGLDKFPEGGWHVCFWYESIERRTPRLDRLASGFRTYRAWPISLAWSQISKFFSFFSVFFLSCWLTRAGPLYVFVKKDDSVWCFKIKYEAREILERTVYRHSFWSLRLPACVFCLSLHRYHSIFVNLTVTLLLFPELRQLSFWSIMNLFPELRRGFNRGLYVFYLE